MEKRVSIIDEVMDIKEVANQSQIFLIYIIILNTNILVNFDHGIIPAATQQIKTDLNIDDVELGMLGSVVYAGLLAGSLAATYFFQKIETKYIIVGTILAYQLSLGLFLMTDNIYILGLSRTLVGFFQVFLVVFFPVWVDLFGGSKQTLWLTFLQLGVPLGVVIGYSCTGLYLTYFDTWQYSFVTQIVCLFPCGLGILYFPSRYLSVKGAEKSQSEKHDEYTGEKQTAQFMGRTSVSPEILNKEKTYMENIQNLFSNKLFLFSMLCLSSLYFVVTGIQFWISDYFQSVLHQPKEKVVLYFTLVSITAPTSGVIMGGYILDKFGGPPNGGYTGEYALDICALNAVISAFSGMWIPFIDNFKIVITLLWLQLFFGGSIMPGVMGIMISSIPSELRAFGNSAAQLFSNLLGYLPAPVLYGIINNEFKNTSDRAGMIFLTLWGFWGVFFLLCGKSWKSQISIKLEKELEKIENIELQENIQQVEDEQNQNFNNQQSGKKTVKFEEHDPQKLTNLNVPLLNPSPSNFTFNPAYPYQQNQTLQRNNSQNINDIQDFNMDKHMDYDNLLNTYNQQRKANSLNPSDSAGSLNFMKNQFNQRQQNSVQQRTTLLLKRMGTTSLEPKVVLQQIAQKHRKNLSGGQHNNFISQQLHNQEQDNNNDNHSRNKSSDCQENYNMDRILDQDFEQNYNQRYRVDSHQKQSSLIDFGGNNSNKNKINQRISMKMISFAQLMGKSNSIYIDAEKDQ